MIYLGMEHMEQPADVRVVLGFKDEPVAETGDLFTGEYLKCLFVPGKLESVLYVGCGVREELKLLNAKEIAAKAVAVCQEYQRKAAVLDLSDIVTMLGRDALVQAVVGLGLGDYSCAQWISKKEEKTICHFYLTGLDAVEGAAEAIVEGQAILEGTLFARNMVNTPGNLLRPMDFERTIRSYVEGTSIECHTLVYGQLRAMGMTALAGVGGSSEYPPCLLVLRYQGAPESEERYGLIGKGITCDTGGYSLKSAGSMAGIKGDMAGAAAVTAAMKIIASQKLPVNVTACLPLAENRISPSSLLPGDVITGYSGKTIEVLNTDAEGRLILSDAISYGVKDEGITKILDIATLTGAVANMLGNTIAGALSDDDDFYGLLEQATTHSAERYLRIPYGKEHRKMINSDVADVKNTGASFCGTITAGLFLREFCEGKPWIHLDIAGTAWCGTPTYAFECTGATGTAVSTLYYMMKEAAK